MSGCLVFFKKIIAFCCLKRLRASIDSYYTGFSSEFERSIKEQKFIRVRVRFFRKFSFGKKIL